MTRDHLRCGDVAKPRLTAQRAARAFALLVAAAVAAPSCSHDSYLVVTLTSADTPFIGVSWIDVDVSGGGVRSPTLSYGVRQPLSFSATEGVTFSLSFTPSRSGNVTLSVTALGADHSTCIGRGTTDAAIKKGDVANVAVQLRHGNCAPIGDGGPPPDGNPADGSVTFPGCDPTNPAASCQAGQTCFVDCVSRAGLCVAGGKKGPGEACQSNNDCMPGTQCFDYSAVTGCAAGTRICLKFCANDGMCQAAPGGGQGGNAGSGGSSGRGDAGAPAGAAGGAGIGGASGLPTTGSGGGGVGGGGGGGGAGDGAAGSSGTAALTSRRLLAADTPAELTPSACRNPVACSAAVVTSYRTCSLACDPRRDATAGCPAGLFCFLYRDPVTGLDNPDCGCRERARVKTEGMACTAGNECAPGLVCNVMSGAQQCRPLCKPGMTGDCATGKTCQPLTGAAFGVCI